MPVPQPEVLWDHLRRHYGRQHEITVDEVLASLNREKHDVSRAELVAQFQEWERRKLGSFTVGRRSRKSRIRLHQPPSQMQTPLPVDRPGGVPVAPYREVELPLDGTRTATLEFPSDLSVDDVERIAEFLRFYIQPQEGTPAAA